MIYNILQTEVFCDA